MAKPLNLLVIMSDQQRYDALGVLNPKIQTPNLDRLAREGLLLERAYPPTPVCLPCRASMVTGQFPSTHGATNNGTPLPEDYDVFFAKHLRDRGYFTHLIGKSHFSYCHDPAGKESIPFIMNRDYYRAWHGPWYGYERADICIGHTTEKHAAGMHYGAWLEDQGVDTSQYFGHTPYSGFGRWDLPEEMHTSKWIADVTIGSLESCADSGRPFHLWVNFPDPHNPCMVPEPWDTMYDPADVPAHGFKPGEPENFADKPKFYQEILDHPGDYAARFSDPEMPLPVNSSALPYTEEEARQNTACYYGMVSLLDKHVGRILDTLDARGLTENTLVVFCSDHGELLGDHGMYWKGLVAFEECQRVPMLARLPGRIPAGARSSALQSLLDIGPTFLGLAGLDPCDRFEGEDQGAAWTDPGTTVRENVIIEERPFHTPYNQRTFITATHKLVYYAGREDGELYDTAKDPDQLHNLWDDPAATELKHTLIRRLLDEEMNRRHPRTSASIKLPDQD